MRRKFGLVLIGLFSFFLVTALMGWFYAPGAVKKTPLNINSDTYLSGEATYLGSGPDPVVAVSRTVADGDRSDDNVVVFTNVSCLLWDVDNPPPCVDAQDTDKRLINASEDTFATDRSTALAVADAKYTVAGDPHQGLINKFPFDVQKTTYPFWDGVLAKAVDAVYQGDEEIDGHRAYVFKIKVPKTEIEVAKGVKGTYTDDKTMWIDPATGSILDQRDVQERLLTNGDTALALDLSFTDEQVAANVAAAKDNGSQIGLIDKLPWFAVVLSLVSLVAGLLALRGGRPRSTSSHRADTDPNLLDELAEQPTRRHRA